MRKIVIIQHCQSEHHVNGLTGGWTDTGLTELGRQQAERVGQRLKEDLLDPSDYKLLSSDLLRTKETAEYVAKYLNKDIIFYPGLREINNGVAVGKTREWAKANMIPRERPGFYLDHREWEQGESWREFARRIYQTMDEIYQRTDQNLIIVTHGCALSNVIAWWMNFSCEQIEKSFIGATPGSITLLTRSKFDQAAVSVVNDTAHLRDLKQYTL